MIYLQNFEGIASLYSDFCASIKKSDAISIFDLYANLFFLVEYFRMLIFLHIVNMCTLENWWPFKPGNSKFLISENIFVGFIDIFLPPCFQSDFLSRTAVIQMFSLLE